MYTTPGDCMLKLFIMKFLVILLAVAVKFITFTVSGIKLRISFKCEYSVLNFSPLSKNMHLVISLKIIP